MHKRHSGFTIVELLIVIVIISILAAITIVSYSGIQKRAQNTARAAEMSQVTKLIDLYRASKGTDPDFTNGAKLCIGTGFPNGKCRDFNGGLGYLESNKEATNMLSEFGQPPTTHYPVKGTVGPYIDVDPDGWGFYVVSFIQAEDCSVLGKDFEVWWNDDNSDTIMCARSYPSSVKSPQ